MSRRDPDKSRALLRKGAAIFRESVALSMYAAGRKHEAIAEAIDVHPHSVPAIIQRGLERRAATEKPSVDAARALYLERLHGLLAAHWPLATGSFVINPDDEQASPVPPDVRSAEFVLKVVDKIAAVQGLANVTNQPQGGVHLHLEIGRLDSAREAVLNSLAAAAAKHDVLDAELADAGANLDHHSGQPAITDRPAPPRQEATA